MDLRSGHPYWLLKNGILASYPSLQRDEHCDIVVIGAGITGALVAQRLAEAGVVTVLLDKRDVGTGSTAASTSMLLYATDTELTGLVRVVGEAGAVRCYKLGLAAVQQTAQLVRKLGDDCGFKARKTLYLASKNVHVARLREEYELRARHGFDVEYLDAAGMAARFPFRAYAGLLSSGDGEIDAFRLTHALLRQAATRSVRIYDRTGASRIDRARDSVIVKTDTGHTVTARRLVFATGYESQKYLKRKLGTFHSTFALITEPVEPFPMWPGRCLIWETNRPYFYLRSTEENRIIVGGADVAFATAHKQDGLLARRSKKLRVRLAAMFAGTEFEVAYTWAGTFGSSNDGLPYIGPTKEWPNAYFALGYGGNGITFSVLAADMIVDHYLGNDHPDAELFAVDR